MKNYIVEYAIRYGNKRGDIDIEAEDAAQAEEKVRDMINSDDFGAADICGYEVNVVEEGDEVPPLKENDPNQIDFVSEEIK